MSTPTPHPTNRSKFQSCMGKWNDKLIEIPSGRLIDNDDRFAALFCFNWNRFLCSPALYHAFYGHRGKRVDKVLLLLCIFFFFTDRIECRQVLNIMVLVGFMFNYMLRVNLTIAIVAMVKTNATNNETAVNSTVFDEVWFRKKKSLGKCGGSILRLPKIAKKIPNETKKQMRTEAKRKELTLGKTDKRISKKKKP